MSPLSYEFRLPKALFYKAQEKLVFEITQYAVFIFIAVAIGGFSLVGVSTFLVVMESLNATFRGLRAR